MFYFICPQRVSICILDVARLVALIPCVTEHSRQMSFHTEVAIIRFLQRFVVATFQTEGGNYSQNNCCQECALYLYRPGIA